MRCMSMRMMPRPYAGPDVRNGPSSVRRCSAPPRPAGAANRQRPCVSQWRRVASSDRAEEAGIRNRSPGPAHKREGRTSACAGLPLAGLMNARHVPHGSPADRCDAACDRKDRNTERALAYSCRAGQAWRILPNAGSVGACCGPSHSSAVAPLIARPSERGAAPGCAPAPLSNIPARTAV